MFNNLATIRSNIAERAVEGIPEYSVIDALLRCADMFESHDRENGEALLRETLQLHSECMDDRNSNIDLLSDEERNGLREYNYELSRATRRMKLGDSADNVMNLAFACDLRCAAGMVAHKRDDADATMRMVLAILSGDIRKIKASDKDLRLERGSLRSNEKNYGVRFEPL